MRKQVYHDPVTGDELSQLEYLTRQLQVLVRTPWFIMLFNAITLVCMLAGRGDAWNYFASWLAIIIEWLVGTFMFGQTARDARVIREVRANSLRDEQTLARMEAIEEKTERQTELLVQIVQGQAEIRQQATGALQEERFSSVGTSSSITCTVCDVAYVPEASGWYVYRSGEGERPREWVFCSKAHLDHWLGRKG